MSYSTLLVPILHLLGMLCVGTLLPSWPVQDRHDLCLRFCSKDILYKYKHNHNSMVELINAEDHERESFTHKTNLPTR